MIYVKTNEQIGIKSVFYPYLFEAYSKLSCPNDIISYCPLYQKLHKILIFNYLN